MVNIREVLIYFCLLMMFALFAYADNNIIEPYDQLGEFQNDYNGILSNIKKDDILRMPDGNHFRVVGRIQSNRSTTILRVIPVNNVTNSDSRPSIMRLPRKEELLDFHQEFVRGAKMIGKTKLGAPEIYFADNKYALVENIDHSFSLKEFLENKNIPKGQNWEELAKKLKKYARDNHDVINIGDFRAEQIIYDLKNKSWRLVDWMGGYEGYNGKNIGEHFLTFDKLDHPDIPLEISDRGRTLLGEINEDLVETRLLTVLNQNRPASQTLASLDEVLKTPQDIKNNFSIISEGNNNTYKMALIDFCLINEKFFNIFKTPFEMSKFFKSIGKFDTDLKIKMTKASCLREKSVQVFLEYMDVLYLNISPILKKKVDELWIDVFPHFLKQDPDVRMLERALRMMTDPARVINILRDRDLIDGDTFERIKKILDEIDPKLMQNYLKYKELFSDCLMKILGG